MALAGFVLRCKASATVNHKSWVQKLDSLKNYLLTGSGPVDFLIWPGIVVWFGWWVNFAAPEFN